MELLGKLVEIQPGYPTRAKIVESPNGGYRLLQARDIKGGAIDWQSSLTFYPELNLERYRIAENDILFTARGYENKAYLANHPPKNILASNTFYILKPKQINPKFLTWWLNGKEAQAYFAQFQVRKGFVYLSKKNLDNLEVPVMSKAIQEKISNVLLLWEQEQELDAQIANLKENLITSVLSSRILKMED